MTSSLEPLTSHSTDEPAELYLALIFLEDRTTTAHAKLLQETTGGMEGANKASG